MHPNFKPASERKLPAPSEDVTPVLNDIVQPLGPIIATVSTWQEVGEPTRHPMEDAVQVVGQISVVADGVTLTPTPEGGYPNPSPVARFSKRIVKAAGDFIKEKGLRLTFRELIQGAVNVANREAEKLNARAVKKGLDYINIDRMCATFVVGGYSGREFHYGLLGDVGIWRIRDSVLTRMTESQTERYDKWRKRVNYKEKDSEHDNKIRRIARQYIRNNPAIRKGYGVISGESRAIELLDIGSFDIQVDDIVIVASDGMSYMLDMIAGRGASAKDIVHRLQEVTHRSRNPAERLCYLAKLLEQKMGATSDDKALVVYRFRSAERK